MNIKPGNSRCVLPLILAFLSGCSSIATIDELKSGQQENTQLLEQQSVRLEMQEEYLAQLAESQQELIGALERLGGQLTQLESKLSDVDDRQSGDAKAANANSDPRQDTATANTSLVDNKVIVGRNEWAWVELLNRNLKARVDTGALSSSLSATELQPFERDGRDWIRFRVPDEDHADGGDVYETPLVKYVRIRHASVDELERRPVVRLSVHMGELVDEVEFNLTNREDMLYPLLLGRNFLRDVALVDVARKFTQPKYEPDLSSLLLR